MIDSGKMRPYANCSPIAGVAARRPAARSPRFAASSSFAAIWIASAFPLLRATLYASRASSSAWLVPFGIRSLGFSPSASRLLNTSLFAVAITPLLRRSPSASIGDATL